MSVRLSSCSTSDTAKRIPNKIISVARRCFSCSKNRYMQLLELSRHLVQCVSVSLSTRENGWRVKLTKHSVYSCDVVRNGGGITLAE